MASTLKTFILLYFEPNKIHYSYYFFIVQLFTITCASNICIWLLSINTNIGDNKKTSQKICYQIVTTFILFLLQVGKILICGEPNQFRTSIVVILSNMYFSEPFFGVSTSSDDKKK